MNLEHFHKTFYKDGLLSRGKDEADRLRELVENGLTLRPKVVITTSFTEAREVDVMMQFSELLLMRLTWSMKSHILPLFCYNCQNEWGWRNDYGRVRNDMHYNLLMEEHVSEDDAVRKVQDYFCDKQALRSRESMKVAALEGKNRKEGVPLRDIDHSKINYWDGKGHNHFPYGDTQVEPYRIGGFWNHYLTMRHRQAFHVTFCPKRKNECKGMKGCIYTRQPERLISNRPKLHLTDE